MKKGDLKFSWGENKKPNPTTIFSFHVGLPWADRLLFLSRGQKKSPLKNIGAIIHKPGYHPLRRAIKPTGFQTPTALKVRRSPSPAVNECLETSWQTPRIARLKHRSNRSADDERNFVDQTAMNQSQPKSSETPWEGIVSFHFFQSKKWAAKTLSKKQSQTLHQYHGWSKWRFFKSSFVHVCLKKIQPDWVSLRLTHPTLIHFGRKRLFPNIGSTRKFCSRTFDRRQKKKDFRGKVRPLPVIFSWFPSWSASQSKPRILNGFLRH